MSIPRLAGAYPAVAAKFTTEDKLDIAETEQSFNLQIDAGELFV